MQSQYESQFAHVVLLQSALVRLLVLDVHEVVLLRVDDLRIHGHGVDVVLADDLELVLELAEEFRGGVELHEDLAYEAQ